MVKYLRIPKPQKPQRKNPMVENEKFMERFPSPFQPFIL